LFLQRRNGRANLILKIVSKYFMKGLTIYVHIGEMFMLICSCVAGVIGYRNRKRHHYLAGIYLYPLASLAHTILFYVIETPPINRKIRNTVIFSGEDIFMFIEFFLIYSFFLNILKSQGLRKLLYLIQFFYVLIVLCLWFAYKNLFKLTINLYAIQTFCILIPVSLYYLEIIKRPPLDVLSQSPTFWVATGITIYFACTTPLFLLKDFIFGDESLKEQNLFLINFIAYGILFLFITKAYLCPKRDAPN
jgi:hypothetical protein